MHRARGPPSSKDRWRRKQFELALFPSPLDSVDLELWIQVVVEDRVLQRCNIPVRHEIGLRVVSRMLSPSFAYAAFAQRHVDVSGDPIHVSRRGMQIGLAACVALVEWHYTNSV